MFTSYFKTTPNANELITVKGIVKDISFKKEQCGRSSNCYRYYFWLTNYSNSFQVVADFSEGFNAIAFRQRAVNKPVYIEIYSEDRGKLNNENVRVYSITNKEQVFLKREYSLNKAKDNSLYACLVGLGMIIAGIVYYIVRYYYWVPSTLKAN